MTDESGLVRHQGQGDEQLALIAAAAAELATSEEVAAFEGRFLRLLERRTAIYTMGDSTSVPKHVAADLLLSICFVLGIDPNRPEIPQRLLSVDLEDEYRRRLDEIGQKVQDAEKLWRDVCQIMPMIENIALRDTLKSIGDFFKWYDYRSMAHEIPCSIDYLLCHPLPETLQGIDYIDEYLRRLMIEAEFLARFEIEAVERVLAKTYGDYLEPLVNLYEPVATNAIGLAQIGKDPTGLVMSDEDRDEIAGRLRPLGEAPRERALREAAAAVCDAIGIQDDPGVEYLSDLVPELLPRIGVMVNGRLHGVFVG